MGKRSENFEKNTGWNRVDLYVLGDTAVYLVNGHVVNVLLKTSITDDGVTRPLTKEKLQLQSEGTETYFRRMQIRPIASIPHDVLVEAGLGQ